MHFALTVVLPQIDGLPTKNPSQLTNIQSFTMESQKNSATKPKLAQVKQSLQLHEKRKVKLYI